MTAPALRTGSLRVRVTVLVLVFLATMLAVLAVVTDVALSARLDGELRQRLTDRAAFADYLHSTVSDDQLVERLEGDGISVVLTTADGATIAKGPLRPDGEAQPAEPAPPAKGPKPPRPIREVGPILQLTRPLSGGGTITVLTDSGDVHRTLVQVRTTLGAAAAGLLALATVALVPVVRRTLRPLEQLTGTARSITAGDRGRRLRPDRPNTELGRAAAAFDDMLDEVESSESHAREAEQRLRQFLSDAAHELRTPLTGVQAAAERLLLGTPDRTDVENLSVTVIREARRAGRLVEDMLTMARIDAGLDLAPTSTDLLALARAVAENVALYSPEARIEICDGTLLATVDEDRIVQVLTNLVDNAVAAAGPAARIVVTASSTADHVALEVSDDGPGIPAGQEERIFDRLVRLDPSRTGKGSGLGLPIARGIALAHGGRLFLVRDGEPGARFRLELPRPTAGPDRSSVLGA